MKISQKISMLLVSAAFIVSLSGCASLKSKVQDIKGNITGATYTASFYSNTGDRFLTVQGQKINLSSNIVKEAKYDDSDGWGYTQAMSSVVTITIDGDEIINCGSTVIFAEDGLSPDVSFTQSDIKSSANGIGGNTLVAGIVNKYKNSFGKPKVAVIQSQMGDPLCAYSGKEVYWEVCEDLPKTTKLMIDGKALYIHRANFQLIDRDLINY